MYFSGISVLVLLMTIFIQFHIEVSAYKIEPKVGVIDKPLIIQNERTPKRSLNRTLRINVNIDTKISKQDFEDQKLPVNFTRFDKLGRIETPEFIQTHTVLEKSDNQTMQITINFNDTEASDNGQRKEDLTKFRQFDQLSKQISPFNEKLLEKLINQTLHVNIKIDTQIPRDDDDEERKPVDLTKYGQFEHIANWPRDLAALIAVGIRRIVLLLFQGVIKEHDIPLPSSQYNGTTLRTYITF